MREIILKIEDIEETDTAELELLLDNKGYIYDGILVEVKSKIAYVWREVKPKPMEPPLGPRPIYA